MGNGLVLSARSITSLPVEKVPVTYATKKPSGDHVQL